MDEVEAGHPYRFANRATEHPLGAGVRPAHIPSGIDHQNSIGEIAQHPGQIVVTNCFDLANPWSEDWFSHSGFIGPPACTLSSRMPEPSTVGP